MSKSDYTVRLENEDTLREAMKSPAFQYIREEDSLSLEKVLGCLVGNVKEIHLAGKARLASDYKDIDLVVIGLADPKFDLSTHLEHQLGMVNIMCHAPLNPGQKSGIFCNCNYNSNHERIPSDRENEEECKDFTKNFYFVPHRFKFSFNSTEFDLCYHPDFDRVKVYP